MGGMTSVGVFLRDPSLYLSEKTSENSTRLDRQARPGTEHGDFRAHEKQILLKYVKTCQR